MMAVLFWRSPDCPVAGLFPEIGMKQVSKRGLPEGRHTEVERSPIAGEL